MKRNVVVGAWFCAAILTAWGCAEVIGLPDGEVVTPCQTGKDKRCVANSVQECVNGLWAASVPCAGSTCIDGACKGTCVPDAKRCAGSKAQWCVDGDWTGEMSCAFVCEDGACAGECLPGDTQCSAATNTVQACVNGYWKDKTTCLKTTCVMGGCTGECAPGEKQCAGKTVQACMGGAWSDVEMCPFVCNANTNACAGECVPGDKRCNGQTVDVCGTDGFWAPGDDCNMQGKLCAAAKCIVRPPSCASLALTCGPAGNESCCAVTDVPGGTYNRSNDAAYPATVSSFWLDRFEITVGRFRKFVEAYPGNKPMANAGEYQPVPGSGWNSSWNMSLPADQAALKAAVKCSSSYQTWTDTAGANENLPMNCINWYESFAFCAWDGGRLPTEAEWNYAAAGGNEQRQYPWSSPPSSMTIDASYAVYNCEGDGTGGCAFTDILKVGSKSPKGDGRWGQADLGGSMWEWNLDGYGPYAASCSNCANILSIFVRVFRGGDWTNNALYLPSSGRDGGTPDDHNFYIGARCAGIPM